MSADSTITGDVYARAAEAVEMAARVREGNVAVPWIHAGELREALTRAGLAIIETTAPKETVAMHKSAIEHMVSRFLSWRLPDNFSPDGGVSFEPNFMRYGGITARHEPTGTNLFDGQQATAMVRHMVEGLPSDTAAPAVDMGEIERLVKEHDAEARRYVSAASKSPDGFYAPDAEKSAVKLDIAVINLKAAIRTAIAAAEARGREQAAVVADRERDGFVKNNCPQAALGCLTVVRAIRALNKAGEA
jgi:hypothetical protein